MALIRAIDSTKSISIVSTDVNGSNISTMIIKGKPKERRRNNEKRKEKSREAARCRRSRESEAFAELAGILPLKKEDISQLDKTSIMRIVVVYLKLHEYLKLFPKMQNPIDCGNLDLYDNISSLESLENFGAELCNCISTEELINETLDGFLIMLTTEGEIIYTSRNIADFIGIEKIDILGQQIWDYSHQCDHAELREALNIKRNGNIEQLKNTHGLKDKFCGDRRDLFVRFKCTLTSRGRNINVKSASYKVIHITGHLVMDTKEYCLLIAVGRSIPHPSNIEIPLGTSTFLTKHSLDMKFIYVDEKMSTFLGYDPDDLKGKSLFDFHHAEDSDSLLTTFKSAFNKGQSETARYRFLGKMGGFCWVVTQATILYEKLKPQSVICVNYVISNLENNNEIYSIAQFGANQHKFDNSSKYNNIFWKGKNQQTELCEIVKENNRDLINNKCKIIAASNNNKTKFNEEHKDDNDGKLEHLFMPDVTNELTENVERAKVINHEDISVHIVAANSLKSSTSVKNLENLIEPQSSLCINLENNCTIKPMVKPSIYDSSKTIIKQTKQPRSVTASVFRITSTKISNTKIFNNKSSTTSESQKQPLLQTISLNTSQPLESSLASPPRAQSVTASVFTPISALPNKHNHKLSRSIFNASTRARSSSSHSPADMNKGFRSLSEDAAELTMLKQEPDGLISPDLVQDSRDTCIPLDEPTPLFGEMLAGLMPYDSLMSDMNSVDSIEDLSMPTIVTGDTSKVIDRNNCDSNYNNKVNKFNTSVSKASPTSSSAMSDKRSSSPMVIVSSSSGEQSLADPFINYREESNDTICSRHLVSPNITSKSPEVSSLPSLCSPNSLSQEDEFAFMTMNVGEDIDLTMRAPYIPMNEQEDLPLLTTDDLMWCGGPTFSTENLDIQKEDTLQYDILREEMKQQQQTEINRLSEQHFQNPLRLSLASDSSLSPIMTNEEQRHICRNNQVDKDQLSDNNEEMTDSGEFVALLRGANDDTFSAIDNKKEMVNANEHALTCFSERHDGSDIRRKVSITAQNSQFLNNIDFKHQQQRQQHQEEEEQRKPRILGSDVKSKNLDCETSNLCICIEDSCSTAFTNKDSNSDCWRELLQININNASSILPSTTTENQFSSTPKESPIVQQPRMKTGYTNEEKSRESRHLLMTQCQMPIKLGPDPNRLINYTSTKLSVPLPQNNTNLQQDIADEYATIGEKLLVPKFHGKDIKIIANKLSNISTVALNYPARRADDITVIDGGGNKFTTLHLPQQQQQQQQHQQNNKRHFSSLATNQLVDAKRLKNSKTTATIELQNPIQQIKSPVRLKRTPFDSQGQQWRGENGANVEQQWSNISNINTSKPADVTATTNQKQHQESNSVLKNLLISGCDVSAGYCLVPVARKRAMKASALTN